MSLLLSYKFGWNTTSSQMSQSSAPPAKNRRLSRRAQASAGGISRKMRPMFFT